jgi:hypothetical protein
VEICGCLFHFAQALFRVLQRNGLQATYITKEEEKFRLDFQTLTALAFVPVEHVEQLFLELLDDVNDRFVPVTNHLHDKYVIGIRRKNKQGGPLFKPSWWTCYPRVVKESQAAVKIIYPCCLKVKTIHLQSSH